MATDYDSIKGTAEAIYIEMDELNTPLTHIEELAVIGIQSIVHKNQMNLKIVIKSSGESKETKEVETKLNELDRICKKIFDTHIILKENEKDLE